MWRLRSRLFWAWLRLTKPKVYVRLRRFQANVSIWWYIRNIDVFESPFYSLLNLTPYTDVLHTWILDELPKIELGEKVSHDH
jgi:hypothetical protein